jgi:hypothetical protein
MDWNRCVKGGVAVRPTGESLNLQAHRCWGSKISSPGSEPYRRRWWRSRLPAALRRWSRRAWLAQACQWWWSIRRRCVRAFAQALGKRAKTDLIDAAVIAHFAEATKPKLRQMPDEVTRLLADLVARRRQIVEMIAAEAQRTRRMSDKRLTKSVRKNFMSWTS